MNGDLIKDDDADDRVFKALASPTRRRVLDLLKESPRTTGQLCDAFPDLDRTTVLQHLRVLERAELLTGRKVGRERHLSLAPVPIKRIHDRWIGEFARAAVDLLSDLDQELRTDDPSGSTAEDA
ncbi:metalloregulator ArsR/SmtB family transcription factor [Gordonia sp. (in: high G+C Gram-positive bacteria)]|uniref:ArsR/SmtB family transcription factor n=1 Tax=Gordonia sp. (in: high G+C Gram-positive bacteria) TaxID=84139 RepID=UPI001698F676|nr:metalloregulator ArsR/SmtB family transcription factor [Gordonia sp. (in: high G+C Gram-positive bacteria)]NLG45793.1 winged helix-turn-helix transcriptional regulator [Gordonia sp. (in: high G+C Gram-positive bacteria)]